MKTSTSWSGTLGIIKNFCELDWKSVSRDCFKMKEWMKEVYDDPDPDSVSAIKKIVNGYMAIRANGTDDDSPSWKFPWDGMLTLDGRRKYEGSNRWIVSARYDAGEGDIA